MQSRVVVKTIETLKGVAQHRAEGVAGGKRAECWLGKLRSVSWPVSGGASKLSPT